MHVTLIILIEAHHHQLVHRKRTSKVFYNQLRHLGIALREKCNYKLSASKPTRSRSKGPPYAMLHTENSNYVQFHYIPMMTNWQDVPKWHRSETLHIFSNSSSSEATGESRRRAESTGHAALSKEKLAARTWTADWGAEHLRVLNVCRPTRISGLG